MIIRTRKSPLNYGLCNQLVTVYHKEEDGTVWRKEYKKAFLEFKKNESIDMTGSSEVNSFLLIIPGEDVELFTGDKAYLGRGPRITGNEEWADFIPAKIKGLVVIKHVDPKYWNGKQIHVEAGG